MPKATEQHTTAVSCADLARQLPGLHEQDDTLGRECLRLARNSQEYHTANYAWLACSRRIDAVEDLILSTPAMTLADAAAQILMAAGKVNVARAIEEPKEVLTQAEDALHSALFVVAAAAGLNLDDIGFEHYAPYAIRPDAPAAPAAA